MARTRRNWTPQEDVSLRKAVKIALAESRPLLWRELAKSVPGRSNKDCRKRWWNCLSDGPAKGLWSENEDERLIEAVQTHGTNWSQVALAVSSRNSDQCLSHWNYVLNPDINHRDWTTKEDEQLLHAVLSHGTNWTTISVSHTPKRTTLALKNRYSALRLKNENSKNARGTIVGKMLESLSGTENNSMTTCNEKQRTIQKAQEMDHGSPSPEADAQDAEDEEDLDDSDDDCTISYASLAADSKEANISVHDTQMKDSSVASSGSTLNFSNINANDLLCPSSSHDDIGHLYTENWMNDTPYSTQYESTYSLDHSLVSVGSEWNDNDGVQESGSMNTNGDTIDFSLPVSARYNIFTKPIVGSSAYGNTADTESSHSNVPRNMSTIRKDCQTTQCNVMPTYEVTVDVVCAVTELEGLMARLATIGSSFTVKIKPKLSKI